MLPSTEPAGLTDIISKGPIFQVRMVAATDIYLDEAVASGPMYYARYVGRYGFGIALMVRAERHRKRTLGVAALPQVEWILCDKRLTFYMNSVTRLCKDSQSGSSCSISFKRLFLRLPFLAASF